MSVLEFTFGAVNSLYEFITLFSYTSPPSLSTIEILGPDTLLHVWLDMESDPSKSTAYPTNFIIEPALSPSNVDPNDII